MADTYAVNPGQGVQVASPSAPVLDRSQVIGGGTTGIDPSAVRVNTQSQRNLDAILKLSSGALQPHIKEAQQRQYMEGMRRAAEGEALTEIIEDQPWYTRIFGPSAAMGGARAFAAQKNISQFGADMERRLPELAKQGPDALVQASQAELQKQLTGDAVADAVIMQSYAEQLGPMMKSQARMQAKAQQEQARRDRRQTWFAEAEHLGTIMGSHAKGDSVYTDEDVYLAQNRMMALFTLGPGEDPAAHEEDLIDVIGATAQGGNFRLYEMLDKEGIFKKMDPTVQARLRPVLEQSAKKALVDTIPLWVVEAELLVGDTMQNPAKLPERAAAFNEKVARATGIPLSLAQAIPPSSLGGTVGGIMSAQAAELLRQQRAAAEVKEDPDFAKFRMSAAAFASEDPLQLAASRQTGVSNAESDNRVVLMRFKEGGIKSFTPADMQKMSLVDVPAMKTVVQQAFVLADGKPVQSFIDQAELYANTPEAGKGKYWSTEQQRINDTYLGARQGGTPTEAAYNVARFAIPQSRTNIDPETKDITHKAIRALAEKHNENFFGWNSVSDEGLAVIASRVLADKAFVVDNKMDPKTLAQRIYASQVGRNQWEVFGYHVIENAHLNPSTIPTFMKVMSEGVGNKGPKDAAAAFSTVLDTKLEALGTELGSGYRIWRDVRDGKSVFTVDSGGAEPQYFYITEDEIRAITPDALKVPALLNPDLPEEQKPAIFYRKPRKE